MNIIFITHNGEGIAGSAVIELQILINAKILKMDNVQTLKVLQSLSNALESVRLLAKSQVNAFDPAWQCNEDAERHLKEARDQLFGLRSEVPPMEAPQPHLDKANVMRGEAGPLPTSAEKRIECPKCGFCRPESWKFCICVGNGA